MMPQIIARWSAVEDFDRNIFPIIECVTAIASAVGSGFKSFAQHFAERCARISTNVLLALSVSL